VSGTRTWILILTLVSFLAGVAVGLLVGEQDRRNPPADAAFGDFERLFTERFQLDEERQRLLAGLQTNYNRELEEIERIHAAEHQKEREPAMLRAGLEYRSLIRNHLLPVEQRPEFDRLIQANFVEIL